MATVQYNVTKQMMATQNGGDANPGDLHIPIGRWTALSWNGRATLWAPINFAGMTAITEARLYLRAHVPGSGWHAKGTTTTTLECRRKTSDWNETSHGGSAAVDEVWGDNGGNVVNLAIAASVSADAAIASMTHNNWYFIPITSIVQLWHGGWPNYGVMLFNASSESDAAYAKEFWSRHQSGSVPYMWIDYTTNTTPNAPTGLAPSGDAVLDLGRTPTYYGVRSDPDGGDYITAYQIIVTNDASAQIQDSGQIGIGGSPTTFGHAMTLPGGYNADAYYRWKARTRDKASVWGPYSALQRFRPNSPPNAPMPTGFPGGMSVTTDTLTPTFAGGFVDPDATGVVHTGDDLAAISIEVWLTASPYTLMWSSGEIAKSGASWTQVYAGSALSWGVSYSFIARVKDALGAWSAWSSASAFTPVQATGPDNLTPRTTATKQNSLTPTLTVGHSALFQNEQIEVRTLPGAGTLLWTKTWEGADYADVTSKARTYAGTALSWGGTYYWRAQIELADASISAWSAWVPFYVNALPLAPVVTIESDAGIPSTARPSDGMAMITDSTPVIRAPFADPDKAVYGDAASARRIEIRRADTQAALSGYPNTAGTTDTHTVTTALTADLTYEVRVGFRDDAGQPAATYVFSAWKQFRYSQAPSATLTAPTGGSSVTDATPTLDWAFTSPGSKAQRSYRVQVFDKGPTGANYANEQQAHDTGTIISTATAWDVPVGVLVNSHDYRWQPTVEDTDGLLYVLT